MFAMKRYMEECLDAVREGGGAGVIAELVRIEKAQGARRLVAIGKDGGLFDPVSPCPIHRRAASARDKRSHVRR